MPSKQVIKKQIRLLVQISTKCYQDHKTSRYTRLDLNEWHNSFVTFKRPQKEIYESSYYKAHKFI